MFVSHAWEYNRTKAKCLCMCAFTAFFSKYLFIHCILFLYYNGNLDDLYIYFLSFLDHMKRPRWRQTILFSFLLQLIIVIISINPIPTWHLAFFYFYPHLSSYFFVVVAVFWKTVSISIVFLYFYLYLLPVKCVSMCVNVVLHSVEISKLHCATTCDVRKTMRDYHNIRLTENKNQFSLNPCDNRNTAIILSSIVCIRIPQMKSS